MQTLLHLSNALALAFHTIGVIAAHSDKILQTQDIAHNLSVSEHHLQKIHQRLTKAGILKAFRGPKGGFQLNRPANEIRLLEIYEAIEGKIYKNQCILGHEKCISSECVVGKMMETQNEYVINFLKKTTAEDLAHNGLKELPIGQAASSSEN